MKRKAVFWAWLCAGALACAAADEKKTDANQSKQSGDIMFESVQGDLPERAIPGGVPEIPPRSNLCSSRSRR